MVVCMDDVATQLMLALLIIDHLAVVHQGLDACNVILGALSWPGYNIFEFSKVQMGVDIICHSLVYSVEEGRSFCLGRSLFLFTAHRHPLQCISRDFVSRKAKMYWRWSLLSGMMWFRRSQFSRICQNMEKEWYASFKSQL